MCGLVSVISSSDNGFRQGERETFESMLFLNQLRGSDSTGIFSVDNDGKLDWVKQLGAPQKLFAESRYKQILGRAFQRGQVLVGHGRYATRGDAANVNHAHPFQKNRENGSSIVLVHNGTLDAWQPWDGLKDFEVDSEWFAALIAGDLGYETVLEKIRGAVATIWYDSMDGRTYWYRNQDRPLSFVQDKNGTIYLNSEWESLVWARAKRNIPFEDGAIVKCEVNRLYMFDPKSKTIEHKDIDAEDVYSAYSFVRPTVISGRRTEYKEFPRDLDDAAKQIWQGRIKEIVFSGGSAYFYNNMGVNLGQKNTSPFRKKLAKMQEVRIGLILMTYSNGKEDYAILDDHGKIVKIQKNNPDPEKTEVVTYGKNNAELTEKKVKVYAREYDVAILREWGRIEAIEWKPCEDPEEPFYEVKRGNTCLFEIFHVLKLPQQNGDKHLYRCYGSFMTAPDSAPCTATWTAFLSSPEEAWAHACYSGKVSHIIERSYLLQRADEHDQAPYEAILTNVEGCELED